MDLLTATHATLAGLAPDLGIAWDRTGRRVIVLRHAIQVAELSPATFRLLPDGRPEPLTPRAAGDRPAIRRQVARRLLLPDVNARPARAAPVTPRPSRARAKGRATPRPARPKGGHAAGPPRSAAAWALALQHRGVPAEVRDGVVQVRSVGTVPVPPAGLKLKKAAQRFVHHQTDEHRDELLALMAAALPGLRLQASPGPGPIDVRRKDRLVARVTRYGVEVRGCPPAVGDLLSDAGPLQAIQQVLAGRDGRDVRSPALPAGTPSRSAPPALAAPAAPVPTRSPATLAGSEILLAFPGDLPDRIAQRAIAASAQLRTSRRLVPAVAVEVATPQGTLTFAPVTGGKGPVEAPFRFTRAGVTVSAALRLRRPDDPLALRLETPAPRTLVGQAWAAALIVYAELTCHELEPSVPRGPAPQRPGVTVSRGWTASPRRPIGRSSSPSMRRVLDAPSLQHAIRQLEAVAGHLRRLRPGHRASDEALAAARASGIDVPPGFTFVRPHGRGEQAVVRVAWPRSASLW